MDLRRFHTVSEQKVGVFEMANFFRVPPPENTAETVIRVPAETQTPFYMTRAGSESSGLFDSFEDDELEQVAQFTFNRKCLLLGGAVAHLFPGTVELFEVTQHDILDNEENLAKDGYRLKMVIRTLEGEEWGTVWYDYLTVKSSETHTTIKVVNPLRDEGLMTTIEEVIPSKYVVFVDYARTKVAVGLELYRGDEAAFERVIKDYEDSLQSLQRSRTASLERMRSY